MDDTQSNLMSATSHLFNSTSTGPVANSPIQPAATGKRIIVFSNVYDENYHAARGEEIERCMGVVKRRDLFICLANATGKEVVVLSSPPKPSQRRKGRWLPAVKTQFGNCRQLVCGLWDAPKLRIPFSWISYAWQALRKIRSGDVVLIDNYEFIYVFAAYCILPFRRVTFIFDYEDGKHLIDHSWPRILSGLAEWAGRPLIRAAFLAHPAMGERLPTDIPKAVVPGFVNTGALLRANAPLNGILRFVYSGSLDKVRGVDLLLKALEHLPESGWHLDISGAGRMARELEQFAAEPRWRDKITFHRDLPAPDFKQMLSRCHVGLNCQRAGDPISDVTFPSKVFTYLSAGLLVISSRASAVPAICDQACIYFREETPQALANVMREAMQNFSILKSDLQIEPVAECYSLEGTTERLRTLLGSI